MAKKTKKKTKKNLIQEMPENMLPQNILPMGERVEEDKNIYISQAAYKKIHKFTKNKTTNESGGMLIGSIIEEFGKTNIVISDFVEAKYCEATPTTLKFTHQTWDYVHKEIEKKHKGKKIVGWIHTHPDFGIFLSEYDKFIHQNFFSEDHQVAYVVDPIGQIEGFYFWINGKIERCNGFYIYDKTGVGINIDIDKNDEEEKPVSKMFDIKGVLITILTVVVAFLIFSNISTNKKLKNLEKQQETLANSANQTLAYMQMDINSMRVEVQNMKAVLIAAGLMPEPEPVIQPEAAPKAEEKSEKKSEAAPKAEGTKENKTETEKQNTSEKEDK